MRDRGQRDREHPHHPLSLTSTASQTMHRSVLAMGSPHCTSSYVNSFNPNNGITGVSSHHHVSLASKCDREAEMVIPNCCYERRANGV